MKTCSFSRGQVLKIKDTKYNRLYAKRGESGWWQAVGKDSLYQYDVVLVSVATIKHIQRDAEVASSTKEGDGTKRLKPLNVVVASWASGISGV